jgi:hypothetical protein
MSIVNIKPLHESVTGKVVTTWEENGMSYTLVSNPIVVVTAAPTGSIADMISIFEYMGRRTPERGTGAKIWNHAKSIGANISTMQVETPKYTGKILLYERSFLDDYFNQQTPVSASAVVPPPVVAYTYDPINDDLPF